MKKICIPSLFFLFLSVTAATQSLAWERTQSMGKGMNLSWLEVWWEGTPEENFADYLKMETIIERREDLALMHEMGIETIRLPVCFDVWETNTAPYLIEHPEYFATIDSILSWAEKYDQKVIIDYQHGELNDCNYQQTTPRLVALWTQIATHYRDTDPDKVFFEIFNEPHDIKPENWQSIAEILIQTIRSVAPNHSIIVGGIDYNGITGLRSLRPFADPNIIYTFHFYEPFLFTHQGAAWVGAASSTRGIPYPYQKGQMPSMHPLAANTFGKFLYDSYFSEGQDDYVRFYLEAVKAWSLENNLPVLCGEWGSHYLADQESRCRHARAVLQYLQELDIPHCYWEWNRNFSFFEGLQPSHHNMPECMVDVWDLEIPRAPTSLSDEIQVLIPNPIGDQLAVYFPDTELFDRVEIFNAKGEKWGQYFLGGTSWIKNTSEWPPGMYILRFEHWESGEVLIKKVLKNTY